MNQYLNYICLCVFIYITIFSSFNKLLQNVPVNNKIMETVYAISRSRLFTITHGDVLDSSDMFGIKRGRG